MTMCSMWQIFLHFAVAGNHSLLHIYNFFRCLYSKTWPDIVAMSRLKIGKFRAYITCVRFEQRGNGSKNKLFRTAGTYVIAYS